jgi:alpha-galactosidase
VIRSLLFLCALSLSAQTLDVWRSGSEVRTVEPGASLKLTRTRDGDFTRPALRNDGRSPVHVKEVVLFRIEHNLPAESALYGESFQMLSQTAGTLGKPVDLGYDELAHYKIPQPSDAKVVTGMMTVTPPGGPTSLLGFTSLQALQRALLPAAEVD